MTMSSTAVQIEDGEGTDVSDGQVSIQLLQVNATPHRYRTESTDRVRDEDPVPTTSMLNIAIQTDEHTAAPAVAMVTGFRAFFDERIKRILVRVLVAIIVLVGLSLIAGFEAKIGADVINTDEIEKLVKNEVASLIGYSNSSAVNIIRTLTAV